VIKPDSQQARLLEMLRAGPVTPLMAWIEEGIYRPADPVEKLRNRGYRIGMSEAPFITTRGRRVTFATYWLISEPKEES
jgi:Helix-turn-helix domain